MGCLRNVWAIVCLAALLAACGGDSTKNNGKNNLAPECESNADCPSGVCDISIGACQVINANNTNTNNGTTGSNNSTTSTNNNTAGAVCGDGVIEGNETCDGDCPTECASTAGMCQLGQLQGLSENCSAECAFTDITACTNDDGCCPTSCTEANDNDCVGACGNGVLDGGENCDYGIMGGPGTCPVGAADCNDGDACTLDAATGDSGVCTAQCINEPIVVCTNGDGCCPGACDLSNDDDCSPKVGQPCADDAACPAAAGGTPGFCMDEADYRWPGGACATGCNADADCDAGSHCTGRACVPDCTNDDDCRTGYACYDYFGTGRDMCAPAVGTAALAGSACAADTDCLGALFGAVCSDGAELPGGYCLSACAVDADCAAGTHCGSTDAGNTLCLPDCTVNTDCRAGYECFDWLGDFDQTCGPVANGNGAIGEACTALQDCMGGQLGTCIASADWDQGYCSQTCSPLNACPAGTHCGYIDAASQEGVCLDDCTTANDCRANYSCEDADGAGTNECAPFGNGAGLNGATCAGVYDCVGGADAFCIQETQGWRTGYCSETCRVDADCSANAHCGALDQFGDGVCIANCATGADCRVDGYACYEWDDSIVASLECAPAGTGSAPQGDACTGVWECSGGEGAFCLTNWEGGYCADAGCTSNAECSAGAHCGFVSATTGEGTCIKNCGTDADCRAEYGCFDLDSDQVVECLPEGDGRVGDPCGSFADCGGRENALCAGDPDWPNGSCLLDCTPGSGTTCTPGSACVMFDATFSACLDSCVSSADCRAGYICQNFDGQMICAP